MKKINNDKSFDILFSKIENAFKQGTVNICPKCNNITKVIPNPFYYWECETCGYKTNYTSLPYKYTKDFVYDILFEYYQKYNINIKK